MQKTKGRNLFLAGCLLAAFGSLAVVPPSALAGEVTLEDSSLLVSFDQNSGAITRFENKSTGWLIERRPELGVSFRLLAPLPGRRDNFVMGQKQHAASVEKLSGNQVRLQWQDLLSEHGGVLPMTFTAKVTLTNGMLTFDATLADNSSIPVETVDYPYFGDFNPPARDITMTAKTTKRSRDRNLQADELYPHFRNEKGYWGVFYPLKTLEARDSRDCFIQAGDQGLAVKVTSNQLYRVQYTFEQYPGVISAINALVPPTDDIAGTTVHLEFRTCHFIFAQPHSTTKLVPIVLQCYQGQARAGMNLNN